MKLNAPCKGCPNRILGCHSGCNNYQAWVKTTTDEVAIVRRAKYLEGLLISPSAPWYKSSPKYTAR